MNEDLNHQFEAKTRNLSNSSVYEDTELVYDLLYISHFYYIHK